MHIYMRDVGVLRRWYLPKVVKKAPGEGRPGRSQSQSSESSSSPVLHYIVALMATRHIAAWACSLKYESLPREVIQASIKSFYNWVGGAIGGSRHEATTIAVSVSS